MTGDVMGSEPARISLPLQEARGGGSSSYNKQGIGLWPGELMKMYQMSKATTAVKYSGSDMMADIFLKYGWYICVFVFLEYGWYQFFFK